MQDVNAKATKGWVLALTATGSLMAMLDAMVVVTALGTIRRDLGASIEALEWILNAYNLSFAVLLLTGTALGDRFGRRRMFVAGIGLFVASSVACALAGNAATLIVARTAQGAGAALIMPLAMALLSAAFPPVERGKALGIFSAITGLALIGGPVVGGAIAEGLTWQWIFWLNVPLGLVVIPLALRRIPEGFGPRAAIDVTGITLVTGAALGLVWGLMRGNRAGWQSAEVVAALTAGFLLGVAFVLWERSAREPMLPMRLFKSRAFAAGIGAGFFYSASLYGVLFFLPQFLHLAQGNSPLATGLRLLPWTSTLFVVAPIAGGLINRIGERRLIFFGLITQAVALVWILLIAGPDLPYAEMLAPLILAGSGISAAMPAAQNAVLVAVAKTEVGKASGAFNMLRFLGGVAGIALAVSVFTGMGGLGSAQDFCAGFIPVLGVSALLSLLGAAASLWLPSRRGVALGPAKQSA